MMVSTLLLITISSRTDGDACSGHRCDTSACPCGCECGTAADPGLCFVPAQSAASACTMLANNGTGLRGQAFKYLDDALTPAACCAACEADARCAGWELSRKGSAPRCNLKPVGSVQYKNELCVSGLAPPPPPPKCPGQRPPPKAKARAALLHGAPRPHVFMFLQDDLGHDDVAFYGNKVNADVTNSITAAASQGIVLNRHYVHWHCSPTRRTFLTGRLPLHHSEFLSDSSTGDDIDLRWTTIAQKMKQAGYMAYWYGKGHTGYKSFNHLPLQLGFDAFTGFLGGAGDHFTVPKWGGNCPLDPKNDTYSASLYGELALATLAAYDPRAADAKPLFFYLPWQNVHAPYQADTPWTGDVLRGMLSSTDHALGNIVASLKAKVRLVFFPTLRTSRAHQHARCRLQHILLLTYLHAFTDRDAIAHPP